MAFPTPRSWSKGCSSYIKGEQSIPIIEGYASASVGMGCAMEFASFLKFQKQIKWDEILKNPKEAAKITEMDMKYSLLALASEWYGTHYKSEHLEKILQVADCIQPEFAILLLRFAKARHTNSFKKQAPKLPTWKKIWGKYGKYFQI